MMNIRLAACFLSLLVGCQGRDGSSDADDDANDDDFTSEDDTTDDPEPDCAGVLATAQGVCDDSNDVQKCIRDRLDSGQPFVAFHVQNLESPRDLALTSNGWLWTGDKYGLVAWDVADPFHPRMAGCFPMREEGGAFGLAADGTRLYAFNAWRIIELDMNSDPMLASQRTLDLPTPIGRPAFIAAADSIVHLAFSEVVDGCMEGCTAYCRTAFPDGEDPYFIMDSSRLTDMGYPTGISARSKGMAVSDTDSYSWVMSTVQTGFAASPNLYWGGDVGNSIYGRRINVEPGSGLFIADAWLFPSLPVSTHTGIPDWPFAIFRGGQELAAPAHLAVEVELAEHPRALSFKEGWVYSPSGGPGITKYEVLDSGALRYKASFSEVSGDDLTIGDQCAFVLDGDAGVTAVCNLSALGHSAP